MVASVQRRPLAPVPIYLMPRQRGAWHDFHAEMAGLIPYATKPASDDLIDGAGTNVLRQGVKAWHGRQRGVDTFWRR
jgi:hypothetical protein